MLTRQIRQTVHFELLGDLIDLLQIRIVDILQKTRVNITDEILDRGLIVRGLQGEHVGVSDVNGGRTRTRRRRR